jgi:hypothetical protein
MWDTRLNFFFQWGPFYNEIKLRVAVNTESGFLSYLVTNQIEHERNFQNTDRC